MKKALSVVSEYVGRGLLTGWLLLVWCNGAEAQSDTERFWLFADCRPMGISVSAVGDVDEEKLEEQEAAIRAAVESRLRSAHLYQEHARNVLGVNVIVDGTGVSVLLIDYHKVLYDPATAQLSGSGSTWRVVSLQQSQSTHSFVSQGIDQFLADYLRVNEEACR